MFTIIDKNTNEPLSPQPELVDGLWVEKNQGGMVTRFEYHEPVTPDKSETERAWRDGELSNTDWIVPVTDHPQHADYLIYRQALRDYPLSDMFPDGTRPTVGE